ncbi:MAG TPA: nucleotidyltransferase domain-containing protein [Pyrinomonadaceae bacterium]|nr:nucleotidyltransferase domain-containing protein [Pyrinomonadaceae bacterium]
MNRAQIVMGSEKCNNPGMKVSAQDIPAGSLPVSISSDDQEYIRQAARFLREQGAKKVWLFGSLAKGRRPTVHSDFDFAVEGLPGDRLFGSVGHLLQVLPRSVDVVELENCSTLLREQILDHGIVIYD